MAETWWLDDSDLRDDQLEVLDIDKGESFGLVGPPGSGKTNLLLLRAQFLYLSGFRHIRVLSFTRSLAEFIGTGGSHYKFPSDLVSTFRLWQLELLRELGLSVQLEKDFEVSRDQLSAALLKSIDKARKSCRFEALLLDEAQDYTEDELTLVSSLADIVVYAADSRQRIYKSSNGDDVCSKLSKNTIVLKGHWRCGQAICKLADELIPPGEGEKSMVDTCNYDERRLKSSVKRKSCKNLEEQAALVEQEVTAQLKGYPDEHIGVLTPKGEDVRALADLLSKGPLKGKFNVLSGQPEDSGRFDKPVVLSTFHGAKGVEFRAVHLAKVETLKKFPLSRQLAFTAVTRAKTSLSLYHSDTLNSFLESALAKLEGSGRKPSLKAVFGKEG